MLGKRLKIKSNWKSVNGLDWKLLHKQKLELVGYQLYGTLPSKEAVDGLINFLDTLQDEAEEQGLFKFPEDTEKEVNKN